MDVFKKSPAHLIYLVVFLFPILVATVNHGAGVLYILLLLFGLIFGWSAWSSLELWEKKVLFGFVLFFILINISFVNADEIYNGIKKVGKYLLFPMLIPMYLLMKKYMLETGKAYLFGLFVAAFVMFGQGVLQVEDKYWRRAEGAYHALLFGDIAMLIAVIIICAMLSVSSKWWHYLLGVIATGAALSASVLSGSKGAWLALPIVVVWFLWLKRKNLRPIYVISIILIFSLLIGGALSFKNVKHRVDAAINEYQTGFSSKGQIGSIGVRQELWRHSITIWKVHPVLGTGIGDFHVDVKQLIDEGQSELPRAFGHAHNIYFDALATTGLVGFLALLIFMQIIPFQMFNSFWKKEKDPWIQFYALAGMATIISFAVFGLSEGLLSRNPFIRTYLMSILVFMSSIAIRKKLAVTKDSLQSSVGSLQ